MIAQAKANIGKTARARLDVKAGDRVLFGKYTSAEIKVDGEELLIMREDEILGIIERASAAAGSGGSQKRRKQRRSLFGRRPGLRSPLLHQNS